MRYVFIGFGVFALIAILALIFAFPTMWAVNYLFTAALLTYVFGVPQIGFWQAIVLNFLTGWFFKSYSFSSKD